MRSFTIIVFLGCLWWPQVVMTSEPLPGEYVTTTPVVADGLLYIASFDKPWRHGHVRAIDISGARPAVLWDAAERVPLPGTGSRPGGLSDSDPPAEIARDNRYRSLFTNLGSLLVPLVTSEAGHLQASLGAASEVAAVQQLSALRGRSGITLQQPLGDTDKTFRLAAFSRSSPALVGRSPNSLAERDRVLYLGAEDGLLHALLASRWDADSGDYLRDDPAGGTELWGYLPESFLPHLLEQQTLQDPRVHLDGSPAVTDVFAALPGEGRRSWRTWLAATGTVASRRQSNLFVMDVSDPYRPMLLWERFLPGDGMGRSRGVTFPVNGSFTEPTLYLNADFAPDLGQGGVHASAVEAKTGQLLWQFSSGYDLQASEINAPPAPPALMARDGGEFDTLLFGDMAGRLWALDRRTGQPLGGEAIFTLPAGAAEPIGAGVAVYGRVAIFGTGGVAHAANRGRYAIYAVEVLPQGGRLLWSYPLALGEKVWDTPTLDAAGNLYFATAVDYLQETVTSGRVVVLDHQGVEKLSRPATAATIGRVVTAPGLAVSVALTGEVTQFGAARRTNGATLAGPGSVKILSWRQR